MSDQGVSDDDEQPHIACRVEVLERYCGGDLSLEGLQERTAGIPPDAVRGSDFFHRACRNKRVRLNMIEYLLDAFPEAARSIDDEGRSPLHNACVNGSMIPGIIRVLLDRWPEAVNRPSNRGTIPLHSLAWSHGYFDDIWTLAILDLLLAAAPLSASTADSHGHLPIHFASLHGGTVSFCKRLIGAYPASIRVRTSEDAGGDLPIHLACQADYFENDNIDTVKCLLDLYPESISARDSNGDLPIHNAASMAASDQKGYAEIIKYLLAKDSDCASETGNDQRLPLHYVCDRECLESARLLFDAYPEAINIRERYGNTPLDTARRETYFGGPLEFMEAQSVYANLAEDSRAMRTPDENGWLPLHRALRDGACLGAIKLLINGNPSALRVATHKSAYPLHIACEFSTAEVVQHIIELLGIHPHEVDLQRDSSLHYACRGGNASVVQYLLERGDPSVSEPNSDGKLPVHLLWESDRVDRNSLEYVDAVLRLLLAHPETIAP